jgi:16S rRNA (uracil1498-N3)-methyltransferase
MELFYAHQVEGSFCYLDAEESGHCVRVLRHRAGDAVDVIDGAGTLYHCRLSDDSPKGASAEILSAEPGFGAHPYVLTLACCPTKNNERYEWFVEKATEIGIDRIVPVIGERSERKVYKKERAERIALSATKQSLKARIPSIEEPVSVRSFIASCADRSNTLRLIAYCFEDEAHPRMSIKEALAGAAPGSEVVVLIGPEGDFSPEEAALALSAGFRPIHLGASRLRTETAAITAAEAVYLHFI